MKAVVRKLKNKYELSIEYRDKLTDKRRFKRVNLFDSYDEALIEKEKLNKDIINSIIDEDYLKPKIYNLNKYIINSIEKEHKRGMKESTYYSYINTFNTHIKNEIGEIIIDRINSDMLQAYIDSKAEKYSKSTVNIILSIVKKGFNEAILKNILSTDITIPIKVWGRSEKSSAKSNYLSTEDLKILIEKSKGTELCLQILLAVTLGLRASEVLGLKWSCVDLGANTIYIENISSINSKGKKVIKNTTKNGNTVKFEIPEILKQELIEYKRKWNNRYNESDLLFNYKNNPVSVASLSSKFKRFANKLGYNITFHGLRHSCSTMLFEQGFTIEQISKILNHKNKATTDKVYIHLSQSTINKSTNTINRLFA